jgi:site-specific recombinase XerD
MTRSPLLTSAIGAFVAHKQALARKYVVEAKALALFARCLAADGITEVAAVTPLAVETFLASRPRTTPRSYNHLLGVLRGFFNWTVDFEMCATSPVRGRPRRQTRQRLPFLFDRSTAQQLVCAAAALQDLGGTRLRGPTYATAFALLYGLGLRVGEVTRLTRGDVDLQQQLLVIRATKFGKSRLVPIGPVLMARVTGYITERERELGQPLAPDALIFVLRSGRGVHPGTLSQTFHQLVTRLAFPRRDGVAPPRLHDLRHSFAVGTLLRWYRSGEDPTARLLHLSTFLGHVNIESTAVYLTITPELLDAAGTRFADLAASLAGTSHAGLAERAR